MRNLGLILNLKENEALKKKQHEEILRGRNEQLNLALNSLLIPGRKVLNFLKSCLIFISQ